MAKLISSIYGSPQHLRPAYHSLTEKHQVRRPVMIISEDGRYEMHNSYSIRGWLKNRGFRYDGVLKCWYTNDIEIAFLAQKYAVRELRTLFKKLRAAAHKRSNAQVGDLGRSHRGIESIPSRDLSSGSDRKRRNSGGA